MQNLLVIELKLMEKFQTLYSLKGVKGNEKRTDKTKYPEQ